MIQSVDRSIRILKALAAGPGRLGVSELSERLGLAKGTVHGLLRTLQAHGLVEQHADSDKYQLGPELLQLSNRYLDLNELRSRSLAWSELLAVRANEAVRVGALHGENVLIVHHVFRPDSSLQILEVGEMLPLHATALGKAVLAFDASGATRPRKLEAFTTRTITDPARLAEELATVRARGWATEFEEHTVELASIAAPIRGLGGLVVGAVGLAGRVERICDSRLRHRGDLISMVRATADAIARDLRDDT